MTENADYVALKIEKFIKKLKENLPGSYGGYFQRILDHFEKIKQNSKNRPLSTHNITLSLALPRVIFSMG